jgi:hypothetical protein
MMSFLFFLKHVQLKKKYCCGLDTLTHLSRQHTQIHLNYYELVNIKELKLSEADI